MQRLSRLFSMALCMWIVGVSTVVVASFQPSSPRQGSGAAAAAGRRRTTHHSEAPVLGSTRATATTHQDDDVTIQRHDDEDPHSHPKSAQVPVGSWMTTTSRRGMLATSSTVVAASLLLAATAPQQLPTTPTTTASWMADPGPTFARKIPQFVREAQRAADSVTAQQIAEFNAWGVTKVPNVVSQEWLDLLREGCELAQDEAGPYAEYLHQPSDAGIFFTDLELARRLPLFAAFSLHGPAAAVAGTLLQSHTIRYLYDQLFIKEAGVHTVTPWHQDNGYWRVRGTQVASVFCPLDPVSRDEGLRFVAGSHRWSQLYNPQHFADGTPYTGTQLPPMPDIDALVQGSSAATATATTTPATAALSLLTFDLQPGDVLVFSARTVHGGPGNWGRALSTRWVGDDARYWDRPGEGAVPTGNVHLHDGDLLAHNQLAFPTSWEEQAAV